MKNLNFMSYVENPSRYISIVREEWTKFLNTCDIRDLSVRREILESWKRSIDNGLSYSDSGANLVLTQEEMRILNVKYRRLITVAEPVLEDFSMVLRKYGIKNTVINLCNEDTVILRTLAGESGGEEIAKYQRLLPGAILNEKYTGTTGVSMAKYTGQPYAVYGEEHFTEAAKRQNCIAAPITNAKDKKLNAIIALSAENLPVSSETMGLIAFVAKTIENKLSPVVDDVSKNTAAHNTGAPPRAIRYCREKRRLRYGNGKSLWGRASRLRALAIWP